MSDPKEAQRRRFIRDAGFAAAATATFGGLTYALLDETGERGKPKVPMQRLPSGGYRVSGKAPADLGIARGTEIEAMVRAAIDNIGGISRYIQKGDVVVIKPNVAFERSPQLGATTNPELLRATIRVCREAGAREVRVCDNPIESPEAAFSRSGIKQAALDEKARLYLPSPSSFQMLEVEGAKWISRWPFFWSPFEGANKVIGISPVKDHNLCRASMTTKNWYGLLGGRRNQFHQDIHGIITDLALMMKPTFVLLDGSRVLFRSGPTGGSLSDVKAGRTIVAAEDSLAADAFGWDTLLERASETLPNYFKLSSEKGLGHVNYKDLVLKETRLG